MELTILPHATLPPPGRRLPPWLKKTLAAGDALLRTREIVARSGVATVCEEARCPNLNECWSKRHATFMILGDHCTRKCGFCAVATAQPLAVEPDEPARLAAAIAELQLRHVVITAVARDDLADEGAGHFAECVLQIRAAAPDIVIEVLPADFHARPDCIDTLCDAKPDIYNHNLETVERLTGTVRSRHAQYRQSLQVLSMVKDRMSAAHTKSGLMLGLGETRGEFSQTLRELRECRVDILTVGQYLQPTPSHLPVQKYYEPAEFDDIGAEAREMGFASVASGPFVRSSYNAASVYEQIARRRQQA